MRGVLAKTRVGNNHQVMSIGANCTHRLLDDSILVVGARARFIFRFGQSEKHYALNAELGGSSRFRRDFIDRKIVHARHRWNLAANFLTRAGEQWEYEILRCKRCFAYQRPQVFGPSQAAGTMKEIWHRVQSGSFVRELRERMILVQECGRQTLWALR